MADTTLIIFAKHPTPGEVNTRLCPPLTPDEAARVHRVCLQAICERAFRSWSVKPIIAFAPDSATSEMRQITGPFIPLRPQGDGDLGQRIFRAAQACFQEGASRVIVLGVDSPTMPDERIEQAESALDDADVVLGPCADGGFYLLGLRRAEEDMFSGVDWGSDKVCDQTTAGATAVGLSCSVIEPWYDVDRFEDLVRAADDLRKANRLDAFVLLRTMESIVADAKGRAAS